VNIFNQLTLCICNIVLVAGVDYTAVSLDVLVIVFTEPSSVTVSILDNTGNSTKTKVFFLTITSVLTFTGETFGLNQATAFGIIPSMQTGTVFLSNERILFRP